MKIGVPCPIFANCRGASGLEICFHGENHTMQPSYLSAEGPQHRGITAGCFDFPPRDPILGQPSLSSSFPLVAGYRQRIR